MVSFLGKSNSIILAYTVETQDEASEVIEQVSELRKFYRLARVSDLIGKGSCRMGMAAIAICRPTKGAFLHLVPPLVGSEVPFTLFVDPSLVGTNQLSLDRELSFLMAGYPDKVLPEHRKHFEMKFWSDPVGVTQEILQMKRRLGPIPLSQMSPEAFFVTWGEIHRQLSSQQEVGLEVTSSPSRKEFFSEQVSFLNRQVKSAVRVGLSNRLLADDEIQVLKEFKVAACVVRSEVALVNKDSEGWRLPVWQLQEAS